MWSMECENGEENVLGDINKNFQGEKNENIC
jgi:hypothetical protein